MNKLYDMLHPENKLINKRLSGNSPCADCKNIHRYTRGTAWEQETIDESKCDSCMDLLNYKTECAIKLSWYEDNDERVNKLERKDRDKYDCGVKCPKTLSDDGYPMLYPNGWFMN